MDKKGTYILIGAAGGYVSGGPIYQRNKAIFMKRHGWDVYYISCCHGKVYIEGLEDFIVGVFTFVAKPAYLFPKRYQRKLLALLEKQLPFLSDNVVIETGPDYTAYWGELLAQKLRGKHIVTLLDEYNEHIDAKVAPFYRFKYNRGELACISDEVMLHIFGNLIPQVQERQYSLPCYCTNSLEESTPDWLEEIPTGDLTIGYIGRLEKNAVPVIMEGVRKYACKNPDKQIVFLCIGGSDSEKYSLRIKEYFQEELNVAVYITGLLFPIPLACVQKCNLIFSTAGSCTVGAMAGVSTVRIHQLTNEIQGVMKQVGSAESYKYDAAASVYDYIDLFCKGAICPKLAQYDLSQDWKRAEACFEKHLLMLKESSKDKTYFNFNHLRLSVTERLNKTVMNLFGMTISNLICQCNQ